MRRSRGKTGRIQNEEYLIKALREEKEFVVLCRSADDAHSKRVSLFNAKRKMWAQDQKKIEIRREQLEDGKWIVRIIPVTEQTVFEFKDGMLVPVQDEWRVEAAEEAGEDVSELKRVYRLMLADKRSREEMVEALGEEFVLAAEKIREEIIPAFPQDMLERERIELSELDQSINK